MVNRMGTNAARCRVLDKLAIINGRDATDHCVESIYARLTVVKINIEPPKK